MDSSLRDTTMNSIARWKRRLEGTSTPGELALIGREAEQLRGLASSRGEGALADQLARLAALTGAPAAVVSDAVRGIAELVGMQGPGPNQAPAPNQAPGPNQAPARPFAGTRVVGASGDAAPPPRGSGAPPPIADGTAGGPPAPSMAMPPPLMMSRIGAPSMVQPSMIAGPAQAPPPGRSPSRPPEVEILAQAKQPARAPVLAGTMLSGGVPQSEPPKRAVPSPIPPQRPAAGSPPPQVPPPAVAPPHVPPPNANSNALPPSVAPGVRPPKLLEGTFLGFRAFRGQKGGGSAASPGGEPKKGLLGLQRLTPLDVNPPRPRTSSYPHAERPNRRLSSRPSSRPGQPQTRVDVPRWFFLVLAAIGTLAAVIVTVIVVNTLRDRDHKPTGAKGGGGSSVASAGPSSGPQGFDIPQGGGPSGANAVASAALASKGLGPETAQMRELLETQRRLALACQKDPATCDRWTLQAIEVARRPAAKFPVAPPPPPDEPLAGWLRPFKMPEQFPVRDEPALRSMFDFSTKNIAGRSAFQDKVFHCSAYQDIFDSTLTKYGAPHWLTAVVFQESACNRLATSQVGAKGLWQFMPESARAYGLRVIEGEIDERLNPIKSTDAAIHFLTDLERELGAWDLALAAYNMGPFGVLARIQQVGGHAGFWELAHANLLPDETIGYVPAIEAYAIALENLHALKFAPYGASPESTAEVIVKPGTRLSLIALAAATSAVHIHELNPEFLRDVVPEDETTARVPDTAAHRAQAIIDSWNPGDRRDTCAPPEFDWGKQQFETSRYAKNCAQAGSASGAP